MPPRPRTPSYFWRRKRTPERLLQPLPALSKKETPTLSLKFWKWPRMPLSQYIAEGPEVPLKARYGKYASSLNPFARHMLARVGHEGRHLSVRHVAPIDDFMAGLTVFTTRANPIPNPDPNPNPAPDPDPDPNPSPNPTRTQLEPY